MRSEPREREGIELVCPFCRTKLARPAEMKINDVDVVSGGTCPTCGALYLVDPTGKNVGELMTQGLGVVADRLSKNTWDLVAGEDYNDVVLSYDWRTHRSTGEPKHFMDGSGRLYVIKFKKEQAT